MKTQAEIEQLAESYLQKNKYNFDNWKEITHVKQTYIACYTQCQEDREHFLSKETLDELFDAHDSDDFIDEDSDKKYTEEDMLKLWNTLMVAMTNKNPIFFKDYINSLNKQD